MIRHLDPKLLTLTSIQDTRKIGGKGHFWQFVRTNHCEDMAGSALFKFLGHSPVFKQDKENEEYKRV